MNPIHRLMEHLETFKEAQQTLAPTKLEQVTQELFKDLKRLGEAEFHEFTGVEDAMLDKISSTLQTIRAGSAKQAESSGVLQSLQEKVEEIRKKKREDTRLKKSDHKVTRFEVVEFLNSTEKQLSRFVAFVREKDANDEELLKFIEEMKKQIEEMKLVRAMNLKSHKVVKGIVSDSILRLLEELLRGQQQIHEERRDLFMKTIALFKKELLSLIS